MKRFKIKDATIIVDLKKETKGTFLYMATAASQGEPRLTINLTYKEEFNPSYEHVARVARRVALKVWKYAEQTELLPKGNIHVVHVNRGYTGKFVNSEGKTITVSSKELVPA